MPTRVANNPTNDPNSKPVKNRSQFKPNRSLYMTTPFGLAMPFLGFETVEGDKLSIRVKTDFDTLNMKAPVMTPLKMNKDYFFASLRSVLPKNAELVITNPLEGEDVIASDVQPVLTRNQIQSFLSTVAGNFRTNQQWCTQAGVTADQAAGFQIRNLIYSLQVLEPIASRGSLANYLGYGWADLIHAIPRLGGRFYDVDEVIEAVVRYIRQQVKSFYVSIGEKELTDVNVYPSTVNAGSIYVVTDLSSADTDTEYVGLNRFVEMVREGAMIISISNITLRDDADTNLRALTTDWLDSVNGDSSTMVTFDVPANIGTQSVEPEYNLGRLVAYQLACAQFYTQDSVDYVYNCKLWHQNMRTLAMYANGSPSSMRGLMVYILNGVEMDYDSISGAIIKNVAMNSYSVCSTNGFTDSVLLINSEGSYNYNWFKYAYFHNLFCAQRSLKYRDYFVGSRKRPLAIGDVDVTVSNGTFSVVDVTKNIQVQRFLNQVNRVGRGLKEYVRGIFGVTPMPDPTEVVFLGSTTDMIGAEETNNTGEAQLSQAQTTTTKMRKNSSQFAFEGSFTDPGFVIGIVTFDVARPYISVTDRAIFDVDRYQMFNPFMQQIGDQEVYGFELIPNQNTNFGYKLRYSEYKQAVDRAVGGFVRFLPGFAFLNDKNALLDTVTQSLVLRPDFIRSRSTEFDRFFVSLPNLSLAGYFHFILRNDIEIDASRPMEAAPSIL